MHLPRLLGAQSGVTQSAQSVRLVDQTYATLFCISSGSLLRLSVLFGLTFSMAFSLRQRSLQDESRVRGESVLE